MASFASRSSRNSKPHPIYQLEAFSVREKDALSPEELRPILIGLSYESMNLSPVERPGQFSVRGGVVDVWLERYQYPVRLDFFGDRVESIYLFDPLVHQPIKNLKTIDIFRYLFTSLGRVTWPKEIQDKYQKLLLSDIGAGDLVVHIDHGIGRFLRVEEKNLEGRLRYYLLVEYAKGEKLYVPVQQIDRLSKYIGVKGYRPRLSYLGTEAWERTKEKVGRDLAAQARDLLKLYVMREQQRRPSYPADSGWQIELENDFPYELTPSQQSSLAEIKSDLEKNRPMDRLLVGDVGFGKTELALRAVFKVVQGGYQVAVLVPTTILAEQHYFTFKERLAKFPVRVEKLSRFQKSKEQARVLEGLAQGEIDIVISTHRLLSADVHLKRIGLLVVDEEHRFGVLAKEKLKKMRAEVDVLALSATPIPRTLYLSLAKIRDLSLISDPPVGRRSIQNYIGPEEASLVTNAVRGELGRGGQVYYLYNLVQGIYGEAEKLRRLVPEARIEVAHGQMPEESLSRVMKKFLAKEIDVLVCTTIIGSGLDIPDANTLIVKNAYRFGLADLYQLRGRVGRSFDQAYAYFLYPHGYHPKGDARSRLEALAEASELGAGASLAEKDLEIRGAGNLLGVEQHGNVSLVGFELYIQLLSRAVEALRRTKGEN